VAKMGQISRETFKKLTLLYLIGRFSKDGAYTSYRVQKVLYFATKNTEHHPFLFRHTVKGQYSRDAREKLDSLVAIGLIQMTGLPEKEDSGAKWKVNPDVVKMGLLDVFGKIAPSLSSSLDESIDKYGYLKTEQIYKAAHEDQLLIETPFGQLLFDENLPEKLEVDLSEDQCEALELLLNEQFIRSMNHIMDAVENTDFDVGEVEVVDSIL
jgi:hypothetical protein